MTVRERGLSVPSIYACVTAPEPDFMRSPVGNPEQERMMAPETDPRTAPAPEDIEDATNQGVSADDPAEGSDDTPGRDEGSAQG